MTKKKTSVQEITNPRKKLKDAAFARLWAKSAGRCEFRGCNRILYEDGITTENCMSAQSAHIIAFSQNGPRGNSLLSKELDGSEDNLMLLCHQHHRLIDIEEVEKYSVEVLRDMKQEREEEIRQLTELTTEYKSRCVVYTSFVGNAMPHVSDKEIREALWSTRHFPKDKAALRLEGTEGIPDWENEYWVSESSRLEKMFCRLINNGNEGNNTHYSIFALAPQPLLVKFGSLLGSLRHCDVYQRNRDTQTWTWSATETSQNRLITSRPENIKGKAVFIMAVSANAIIEKVKEQLTGEVCDYWVLAADEPSYNWLTSPSQLVVFRSMIEDIFNDIRGRSKCEEIHLFMAVPCACAVEVGRAWMPKADKPLCLYNLNPNGDQYINVLNIKAE